MKKKIENKIKFKKGKLNYYDSDEMKCDGDEGFWYLFIKAKNNRYILLENISNKKMHKISSFTKKMNYIFF